MLLRTFLNRSLSERAASVGLEHQGRSYTFGDLAARADRMALELMSRGVGPGDRLAIYLANGIEWIDLYVAGVSLGIVIVPINILYREREVASILEDAQPAAVVAAAAVPGAGSTAVWEVSELSACAGRRSGPGDTLEHQPSASQRDTDPKVAPGALASDSPALIVYTSGTTGRPKGAVLTHGNLVANAANLVTCWGITHLDRLLLALPLFHVHGLGNGLHCWLASGCRMRLETRFEHAAAAGWFLEFEPTVFFGVPTMVRTHDGVAGHGGARDRASRAPVRVGLRTIAARAPRGVSRAVQPSHSRALRHDRDTDDAGESAHWPAPWGCPSPASRSASSMRAGARCHRDTWVSCR